MPAYSYNREIVGYYATRLEAETALDSLVFDLLTRQPAAA